MQALILAGGRGTRLRPLTDVRPKPLLYLPGGTILEYILAELQALAIEPIGIVVHYDAESILAYVKGLSAVTPIRQRAPYTLLGAIASAADWVQTPTLVIHADNYFSASLRPAIVAARSGLSTFFTDAPDEPDLARRLATSGAYILQPEVFELARDVADGDDLIILTRELLAHTYPVDAIPLPGWRRNINEPADLLAVNRFLLSSWHEVAHPPAANAGYDPMALSWLAPDAHVNDQSHMGLYVTVGAGAQIHNCMLHNVLVFPGVGLQEAEEENVILVETRHSLLRVYAPNGGEEQSHAS